MSPCPADNKPCDFRCDTDDAEGCKLLRHRAWIKANPQGCFDWTPNAERCPLHKGES